MLLHTNCQEGYPGLTVGHLQGCGCCLPHRGQHSPRLAPSLPRCPNPSRSVPAASRLASGLGSAAEPTSSCSPHSCSASYSSPERQRGTCSGRAPSPGGSTLGAGARLSFSAPTAASGAQPGCRPRPPLPWQLYLCSRRHAGCSRRSGCPGAAAAARPAPAWHAAAWRSARPAPAGCCSPAAMLAAAPLWPLPAPAASAPGSAPARSAAARGGPARRRAPGRCPAACE